MSSSSGIRPIALAAGGVVFLAVFALAVMRREPDAEPVEPAAHRFETAQENFAKTASEAVLAPRPLAVAPGVYLLGEMAPSVVYAVDTSAGIVLIDAGLAEDHDALVRQMGELGLDAGKVRAVLLTHAHGDHSMGAMSLKHETGATIYAGRGDAQVLREGGPWAALFSNYDMLGREAHPTDVDVELAGGEWLAFGDTQIEVVATPGHTPGSTCYVLNRGGMRFFFGGDTVMSSFQLGTYTANLSPRLRGDAHDFLATLRKLSALPAPDFLLPGHPRHDEVAQDPRIAPGRWASMLERGIHELEVLIKHFEVDGADFLDDQPKEILPGLHYLGDVAGSAVYLLDTSSQLLLIDAPGGDDFPHWLEGKLRDLGLSSRPLTAVLLTSCGEEAVSGLPALVERTRCRVATCEGGAAALRRRGVPAANLLSFEALQAARWLDVEVVALADYHPAAAAYVVAWRGKTVLFCGRMPIQGSQEAAALERALVEGGGDPGAYRRSLYELAALRPQVVLPAVPHGGQNANV
ncbi:MAG TPA: MBL fold metallo-hydrolase, partial [Pirellulales bacterium]|nr:MBL fold metallo-hydrolase [Pirellulales bacterium]